MRGPKATTAYVIQISLGVPPGFRRGWEELCAICRNIAIGGLPIFSNFCR